MDSLKRKSPKYERLEARIAPTQKAFFQYAADLLGRSLTDFMVNSLQKEAIRVIQAHETMQLSLRDQQSFVEALFNPPNPNKFLLDAAKRFQKMIEMD
jgi:uncharacterized protein (DUF1778 family)